MHEFIHKAETYKPGVTVITPEWLWSEKLDGRYALWDGGVTRGMLVTDVPWANTEKDTKAFIATGLWSSLGKPVFAPDWFLDQMPPFLVDGELWMGRGRFQECMSITKRHVPDARWHDVRFMVFGAPLARNFLYPRVVSKTSVVIGPYVRERWKLEDIGYATFDKAYKLLRGYFDASTPTTVELVEYTRVGMSSAHAIMTSVCDAGGEGLMLRAPWDVWMPSRGGSMLKWKPWRDAEGVVIGYIAGDKRLAGMLGALIIKWEGKVFNLSGMDDCDRVVVGGHDMIPGEECSVTCPAFPLSSKITFRYRELTDSGIPKEARYWRKYEEGD
jgi:DNA ligase-1